jgi:glycosyltransferase involved in cell wall biosynthesis
MRQPTVTRPAHPRGALSLVPSATGPRRIRVAQIVTRLIAGAGGVALRGALALDRERFEVVILASDVGSLLTEAEQAGFRVVRLRHLRPELGARNDLLAWRELVGHLGRFDVVHTHSAKAGALGRLAAHRAGVPAVVHTFHGFPFHDFQSPPRRQAYIEIERRLGRITHEFLAVGGAVAAQAIRLRITPPDHVRVIAAAIQPGAVPVSPASRQAARRLLGLPEDAVVVGTVGRLDHQKAPEHLVAAVAALKRPDLYAVWIGDGPLRARTQRRISDRGLTDRFRLLGQRSDVAALLPGLDVFAMASLYEGLPCAVVEAMDCGVPVVATAVNAVPELVVPGRTGMLARPGDPASLARGLAYLLDHPARAARMAAQARAQLGDRFTPRTLGEDLVETYEAALAGPRSGGR